MGVTQELKFRAWYSLAPKPETKSFVNYNADPHPMHLHGHWFQVVEINGVAMEGALRDVVVVPRGQCNSVKVCFDADARGVADLGAKWPLHCHMSFHLSAGMLTSVEYEK